MAGKAKALVLDSNASSNRIDATFSDKSIEELAKDAIMEWSVYECTTEWNDEGLEEKEVANIIIKELKKTGGYEAGDEYEFTYVESNTPYGTPSITFQFWPEDEIDRVCETYIALPEATAAKQKSHRIYTHNVAADIIEEFEDLLDENGIMIPDEAREGNADEACIYGDSYGNLLDSIEGKIIRLLDEIGCEYVAYIFE